MANVTIIGAGLSGLVAARQLRASGHTPLLFDKARGVGGRLATRRVGTARLDHGAQFFTVRGHEFRSTIDEAIEAGAVTEWCRGFSETDGYPRYRGTDGMTSLAKWLAADLDITLAHRVEDLRSVPANAYLISAPIPQALDLLAASEIRVNPGLVESLNSVRYNRCIAGMFVLDGPSAMPPPGAMQDGDAEGATFVADNAQKGITDTSSITVHMSNAWSVDHWDHNPDQLQQSLTNVVKPYAGTAGIIDFSLHKWLYAGPQNPWPDPTCIVSEDPLVLLSGDAFAGPKVEGAFNSGLAAGRQLASALGTVG